MEEVKEFKKVESVENIAQTTLDMLIAGDRVKVSEDPLRRWKWFAGANMAIILAFLLLTKGEGGTLLTLVIACSVIGPFISLLLSKLHAESSHKLRMLSPDAPMSEGDQRIYRIVQTLSQRAGLEEMPEVGIYNSPDMNAFATGASRNGALVAFSTGLVERMDDHEIAAVAAHEVAHIANGDMVSMTLIQSVVNVVVMLVSIPLWFCKFLVSDSRLLIYCVEAIRYVLRGTVLLGGFLVSMAFSRKREFAADAFAAQLTSPDAMASALKRLAKDNAVAPPEQGEFACLKISNPMSFAEIFSSHPPIEKRLAALQSAPAALPLEAPNASAPETQAPAPPPLPFPGTLSGSAEEQVAPLPATSD